MTPPALTEETRIALTAPQLWAVAIAIIVCTFAATMAWFNVGSRLDALVLKLDALSASRWTSSDAREFATRLRHENAGKITVPSTDDVRRDLRCD